MTREELTEAFELMPDWEDRYRLLIELGGQLPPMPDAMKTKSHKVEGCTSQVWMVLEDRQDGRVHFLADRDAHIVRGLIGVLYIIYEDMPYKDVVNMNIDGYFDELGLSSHLSPNRRNGFFSMVEKLRSLSQSRAS